MRPMLAVAAAAAVAALTGVLSGEQAMATGWLPLFVALVLGVVQAEVVLAVWRSSSIPARVVAGLFSAVGVAWGVWIDGRYGEVEVTARLAPVVAAAVAVVSFRSSGSRGDGSPTEP